MEMTHNSGMTHHAGMTDALFDVNDATHIAVSSGSWSDPSTWEGGRVPGEGAQVHIPMGIEVEYDVVSDKRLEVVRVDGALDFATTQDTYMLVESVYTGQMSRLTIGTSDDPVRSNVTAEMVFADGKIDLNSDPDQLGHGLVAEGTVEIRGAEKDSYTTLESAATAGTTKLVLDAGTDGWVVGDTIVIMGTKLGEFQDEYRTITSIQESSSGVTVTLDRALSHDHTSPSGHDLDIYVGNSSRNVVLSSENPEGVRGHVMMMHTPDVSVKFAEFSELGRTDKSIGLDVNGNEAGRYSLHLHETGTAAGSEMAVLYGNSVHGSPGWGIVQHSSAAAIDYNFVHNIDGAGIVSEDGDEIGQWIGNFVTGVAGAGGNFSIQRDELNADFGHSGVAYENQARQIVQQDNIAANANTGWMYRAAETSVDNPDRDALQFDPAPFKNVINNEEPAITGFHGNIAVAVDTVLDTGHRQGVSTTTDLRSDMIGMTAWEVDRVFDIFSYTAEYVIRDGLFIGADGAGRAFRMPEKHEGTSIINSHFENFGTAIYDAGLNNEGVFVGLTFKNVGTEIDAKHYGDDRLQSFSDIKILDRPLLSIDASSDLTMGRRDGGVYISGTITDSAGKLQLGSNRWTTTTTSDHDGIDSTANVNGNSNPEELIAVHGAMRDGDGGWIMPVALWITDLVTGEHFSFQIDIELVGYTDAFLETFEITEFTLPSSEIVLIDSHNHDPSSGGHNHSPTMDGHDDSPTMDDGHNHDPMDGDAGPVQAPVHDHSDDMSPDHMDADDDGGHSGQDHTPTVDTEEEVPGALVDLLQSVVDKVTDDVDDGHLHGPMQSDGDDGASDMDSSATMELGRVAVKQLNSSAWTTVTFEQAIEDAVVIMGPVTNTGVQPSFARVRNVTETGFEFQIEEWDYLDGKHRVEEVSWLALSEGEYTLADGREISAQVVETDKFGDASVDVGGTAAVLAQVGSDRNAEAVLARTEILENGDVAVDLQRQEKSSGQFDIEQIFVVAIDEGETTEFDFVSGVATGVDHTGKTIEFADDYDDLAFLGGVSSINGTDTVALRLDDTSNGSASVFLQEEKSSDREVEHLKESVSFIAGEVGLYELF